LIPAFKRSSKSFEKFIQDTAPIFRFGSVPLNGKGFSAVVRFLVNAVNKMTVGMDLSNGMEDNELLTSKRGFVTNAEFRQKFSELKMRLGSDETLNCKLDDAHWARPSCFHDQISQASELKVIIIFSF